MKAKITLDQKVRTVRIDVSGVPDIDVTTYHKQPRIFRPQKVTITWQNDKLSRVVTVGGLVLKSGAVSTGVAESKSWFSDEQSWTRAPEWIRTLVQQAQDGVLEWNTPDVEPQQL